MGFQVDFPTLVLNPARLFLLCFVPQKHSVATFRQSGNNTTAVVIPVGKLLHTQIFISPTTRLHYLTDYFNTSPLRGALAVIFCGFILRVESFAFSGHVHPTEG